MIIMSQSGGLGGVTAGAGLSGGGTSGTVTVTLDISEFSDVTPANGDKLLTLDSDGANEQLSTIAALATLLAGTVTSTGLAASSSVLSLDIANMTATTTVADADLVVIDDGAGGTLRKMTRANFIESAALDSINIDGGAIDGAVIGANSAAAITGTTVTATEITLAGSAHLDSSPADEAVSGITATFTAGEDLERGEVVFFKASDSKMWKAVATATGTMPVVAMAAADIAQDANGVFLLQGFCTDNGTFPSWTVGGKLYAPEAETGSQNVPEQAAPDSDGDFVQVLGFAITANTVYFNPSNDVIEHA